MQNHNDIFNYDNLPRIIDISALSASTTLNEVDDLAVYAKKHNFIAAFVMPSYIEYLKLKLGDDSKVILGAPIGFPTGADLSLDKVFQVKELKKLGCTEFDMVINIGMLKSGNINYVKEDIAKVIAAADGYPVKVILEVTYLDEEEIKKGSEIVAASGASFVKTGTGYSTKPTLTHHVQIMKKTVGDSIKIKCAGGVKNLDILKDMYNAGATRFGIGMQSVKNIMNSAKK